MSDTVLIPTRYFQVAGFVLAGGDSSRMGKDKALEEVGGLAMVLRAARTIEPMVSKRAGVLVIGANKYGHLGLKSIPDEFAGHGPLAGILTAVRSSLSPWNLIVACDMPYLGVAWLVHLLARGVPSAAEIVLGEGPGGPEPLCALYHKKVEAHFAAALARGTRKITDAFTGREVLLLAADEVQPFDPEGNLFKSVNTPEDLAAAQAKLGGPSEE